MKKKYKCPICGKEFEWELTRTQHEQREHPEIFTKDCVDNSNLAASRRKRCRPSL